MGGWEVPLGAESVIGLLSALICDVQREKGALWGRSTLLSRQRRGRPNAQTLPNHADGRGSWPPPTQQKAYILFAPRFCGGSKAGGHWVT